MADKIQRFSYSHLRLEEHHFFNDRVLQNQLNTYGKFENTYARFEAAAIEFDKHIANQNTPPSLSSKPQLQ